MFDIVVTENGVQREPTAEEVAEFERIVAEIPTPEPSEVEILRAKVAALEAAGLERDMALIELAAMMAGGV